MKFLLAASFILMLSLAAPNPQAEGTGAPADSDKIYKAKCKTCHVRNTSELNEVGQQFKKMNPDSLGSHKENPLGTPNALTGTAKKSVEPPSATKPAIRQADSLDYREPTLKATASEEKKDKSPVAGIQEKPARKESANIADRVPEGDLYRGTARDGSLLFTDNPGSSTANPREKPADKKSPAQSPLPLKTAARPVKKMIQSPRDQKRQETSVPAPTGRAVQSYAGCMEEILLQQPAPLNAQQSMAIFTAAEKACAKYEAGNR